MRLPTGGDAGGEGDDGCIGSLNAAQESRSFVAGEPRHFAIHEDYVKRGCELDGPFTGFDGGSVAVETLEEGGGEAAADGVVIDNEDAALAVVRRCVAGFEGLAGVPVGEANGKVERPLRRACRIGGVAKREPNYGDSPADPMAVGADGEAGARRGAGRRDEIAQTVADGGGGAYPAARDVRGKIDSRDAGVTRIGECLERVPNYVKQFRVT